MVPARAMVYLSQNLASTENGEFAWSGSGFSVVSVRRLLGWLGINGIKPAQGGAAYQAEFKRVVTLLTSHGLAVLADLHVR